MYLIVFYSLIIFINLDITPSSYAINRTTLMLPIYVIIYSKIIALYIKGEPIFNKSFFQYIVIFASKLKFRINTFRNFFFGGFLVIIFFLISGGLKQYFYFLDRSSIIMPFESIDLNFTLIKVGFQFQISDL